MSEHRMPRSYNLLNRAIGSGLVVGGMAACVGVFSDPPAEPASVQNLGSTVVKVTTTGQTIGMTVGNTFVGNTTRNTVGQLTTTTSRSTGVLIPTPGTQNTVLDITTTGQTVGNTIGNTVAFNTTGNLTGNASSTTTSGTTGNSIDPTRTVLDVTTTGQTVGNTIGNTFVGNTTGNLTGNLGTSTTTSRSTGDS